MLLALATGAEVWEFEPKATSPSLEPALEPVPKARPFATLTFAPSPMAIDFVAAEVAIALAPKAMPDTERACAFTPMATALEPAATLLLPSARPSAAEALAPRPMAMPFVPFAAVVISPNAMAFAPKLLATIVANAVKSGFPVTGSIGTPENTL